MKVQGIGSAEPPMKRRTHSSGLNGHVIIRLSNALLVPRGVCTMVILLTGVSSDLFGTPRWSCWELSHGRAFSPKPLSGNSLIADRPSRFQLFFLILIG